LRAPVRAAAARPCSHAYQQAAFAVVSTFARRLDTTAREAIMKVPSIDLPAQARSLGRALHDAVAEVLADQQCILGPHVERFERAMAGYVGVAHADVDPATYNLDPASVDAAIAKAPGRVAGIVPVHLYGRLADLSALGAIAARHGCWVLEDAAQAIGARRDGRHAGTVGRAGCFSFYPTKNLGALGDGGMVVTDDDAVAARLRRDRHQGQIDRYHHASLGMCSRLDAVQAAVLATKLPHLERWNARRRAIATAYDARLRAAGLVGRSGAPLVLPPLAGEDHVWHQYVVRAARRDALLAHLAAEGIGAAVYYPVPLHRQPPLAAVAVTPVPLGESERAARDVLALPIYAELDDARLEAVVDAVRRFYA
jgi:dTDP-4-amino-4,6-dideoxygalactose transaminase